MTKEQENWRDRNIKNGMSERLANILCEYYLKIIDDGDFMITNPVAYAKDNPHIFTAIQLNL